MQLSSAVLPGVCLGTRITVVLFRQAKGQKTRRWQQSRHMLVVFRFGLNHSQRSKGNCRAGNSWRGYQQGVWAPEPPGNHEELQTITAEYKGGSWAYLHECCFQLLLRNLFSSSSGSRKCTAGRMGASSYPCLSCFLNKPEKMSSDW